MIATVDELVRRVRSGRLAPDAAVASARAAYASSEEGPEPLHAFLSTDFEGAAEAARGLVGRPGGEALPLLGVPVAVKDNLVTLDLPTTCGSRVLDGYLSPFEATAVRRLREFGAVVVGKTNLDEFAMGSSTEHSAFGPTRHPLDRARVPGGSSGGSAAAVAAGIVPAALGSETGGSVRQPAAFCGVVGLKPTYGRVSRYGLVAFASSLDQVGVIGRTVRDAARLLDAVSGHDPLDPTSAELPPTTAGRAPADELDGLVVGVPEEYFPRELDRRIARLCRTALRHLEGRGAEIRRVTLPHTRYALPAYQVLSTAEAASNLARFDGVRYGAREPGARSPEALYERTRARFGPEVKRRILLGTHVLASGAREGHYARAQRVRARIAAELRRVFLSGVDLLFTPTTPTPAFRLGERLDAPYEMYRSDLFTVAANLAGVPALSLPIGRIDGLPVGGQLIGPAWEEARIVRAASALERALAADTSEG